MSRPTITDYIDALESPQGVFRTMGEIALRRDVYGAPELYAGNSSVVFPYTDNKGGERFLKCYIRPNSHLRTIYDYIERHRPTLLPAVRLLPDELFVHTSGGTTGWVDVVEGEWTRGDTLARTVALAAKAGNGKRLGDLADSFDAMCGELLSCEWAHGDLKPENIIVGRDGAMTLIDCDAMWIPALAGQRAVELGTPPYRLPYRRADNFDKAIDDHPAALISMALRLFSLIPSLWPGHSAFEDLVIDLQSPDFPGLRLQGAIGSQKSVEFGDGDLR
jgi:serine/threonine protein kinase